MTRQNDSPKRGTLAMAALIGAVVGAGLGLMTVNKEFDAFVIRVTGFAVFGMLAGIGVPFEDHGKRGYAVACIATGVLLLLISLGLSAAMRP